MCEYRPALGPAMKIVMGSLTVKILRALITICQRPQACEPEELTPVNTLGAYQGSTRGRTSEERGSCGGGGAEAVYTFSIAGDSPLCLSAEGSGDESVSIDPVLYVRTDCGDASSEVACNDDRRTRLCVDSRDRG